MAFSTTLVVKANALGSALNQLSGAFDQVKQKSLFSTKQEEKRGDALNKLGLSVRADQLALENLVNTFGSSKVDNIKDFATEADKLNREFARLAVELQAFVAGPLAELLKAINAPLEGDRLTRERLLREGQIKQSSIENAEKKLGRPLTEQEIIKVNRSTTEKLNKLFQKTLKDFRTSVGGRGLTREEKNEVTRQFLQQLPQVFKAPLTSEQEATKILQDRTLQLNVLQAEKQVRELVDRFNNAQEERNKKQARFDQQRADIVLAAEQTIANLRLSVERRVQDIRIQNIQRENALLEQQAQNRIQAAQTAAGIERRELRTEQA